MATEGKWYRVCLNTIVRKGRELDSERLRILPMGSRVRVVQQVERRVRIDMPVPGWCSIRSSNGDTILSPLESNDGGETPTSRPQNSSQQRSLQKALDKREKGLQNEQHQAQTNLANTMENMKRNTNISAEDKQRMENARAELERLKKRQADLQQRKLDDTDEYKEAESSVKQAQQNLEKQLGAIKDYLQSIGEDTGDVENALTVAEKMSILQNKSSLIHNRLRECDAILSAQKELIGSLGATIETDAHGYRKGDVVKWKNPDPSADSNENCFMVRAIFRDNQDVVRIAVEAGGDDEGDSNGDFEGKTIFQASGQNRAKFLKLDECKRLTSASLLMMLIGIMNQIEERSSAVEGPQEGSQAQ